MSDIQSFKILSVDLAGMKQLADSMLQHLRPPLTIGLVGTLGAGKTSLTQAIARAAGIDSSDVTSPTFTLLQTHNGRIRIHHLDAYRIADEDEFLELGIQELFEDQQAWTVIEWADRVEGVLPIDTLWITIEIDEGDASLRSIEFTAPASMAGSVAKLV